MISQGEISKKSFVWAVLLNPGFLFFVLNKKQILACPINEEWKRAGQSMESPISLRLSPSLPKQLALRWDVLLG